MKKLLIFTVICLCFAACGSDDGDKTPPFPGQTSIAEVTQKITNSSSGQTANDPVELNVKINASEWAQLLTAINSSGKFVSLDISSCPGAPQLFDFRTYISSTSVKIVSVVLPSGITEIKAGSFNGYTNLRIIDLPASLTYISKDGSVGLSLIAQALSGLSAVRLHRPTFLPARSKTCQIPLFWKFLQNLCNRIKPYTVIADTLRQAE